MTIVYDGQSAADLTRDELIKAILREYDVIFEENTVHAMEEAFRCGFLRGEEYGKSC
jgi:translation elongation factor EF-4